MTTAAKARKRIEEPCKMHIDTILQRLASQTRRRGMLHSTYVFFLLLFMTIIRILSFGGFVQTEEEH